MKSLAHYLDVVARSIDPNGLGLLWPAVSAAPLIGSLQIQRMAQAVVRLWAARS